jgi:hypothetical protein
LIWAVDAYFKWAPGFFGQFVDYLPEEVAERMEDLFVASAIR